MVFNLAQLVDLSHHFLLWADMASLPLPSSREDFPPSILTTLYFVCSRVIIAITTVLYCLVGVKLFKNRDMFNAITSDSVSIHRQSHSFRQYILMPLMIFAAELAVWVAPTTNRIASFIDPSYESYPLLMAVALTGSLRGFWNGVVFVTIGMKSRSRQKELDETILLA